MRPERTIIFHYHLFKNAGSSLDALLKLNFPGRWVIREFSQQPAANRSQVIEWIEENPEMVCFASHTAHLPPPDIPGIRILPVIFVRHPLDRIGSAHSFARRQSGTRSGAPPASGTTLAEYIEARLAVPGERQCRNFQTDRFARLFPKEQGTELERALKAAEALPFVGIVEDFEGSVRRLRDLLVKEGFGDFQIRPMVRNVSAERGRSLKERLEEIARQLGPDLLQRVQEANACDKTLHEHCTRLAAQDLANGHVRPLKRRRTADDLLDLSVELSSRRKHRSALIAVDRAIGMRPDKASFHRQRSVALQGLGQIESAVDAMRHATTLDESNPNLLVRLGNLLAQAGCIDEALAPVERAVANAPMNAHAHRVHARLLMRKGRLDEALRAIDTALILKPQTPQMPQERNAILEKIAAERAVSGAGPRPEGTPDATTYAIGFDERSTVMIDRSGSKITWINCRQFLEGNDETAARSLKKLLTGIKTSMADVEATLTSGGPLGEQIRLALRRGHLFRLTDYDRIRQTIAQITAQSRILGLSVSGWTPREALAAEKRESIQWGQRFYARYGRVELRVIENHLRDPGRLQASFVEVMESLENEAFMYAQAKRKHWLDPGDIVFNLRRLMTNAGFYARDAQDGACLEDWCSRYWDALLGADFLFTQEQLVAEFLVPQDFMAKRGRFTPFVPFPTPEAFYRSLASQDIVFVTPFSDEIQASADDGRLFRLYKDIDIPRFTIRTSRAEISTYPNRPHQSWSETFTRMKHAVDRLFEERAPTLFLASCGCYGLPLCHYVHTTYGCGAVYFGNFMNTLFGIRQATSESFLRERRRDENWSPSRLGLVRNVDRIDGGRYVL